ncbi:glycosyltransferase [Halalkalibacter akibai]|uniref:Capsular polysaccharide biosynthesis protein n=1 Tax=Halalkalibacter akibai (strain ATCC 43226 / DSM 21942 / CIP 109018 / JCM 9157 / 1139) TaxID=1236973 RepID=W4QUX7_HALA3|nr:glycosyltransferase [Halalkalibacter akibai]GAE35930.1 capsular polysaccharide biosynthesis protein [Halalkalibacter akibai JCM 9157]
MCVVYDIISEKLVRELSKQKGGFSDNYKGLKILTIGRLVDAKGYDMAIEACYRLKKEGLEFKWYVIGEGDLEKYKKLVKKYKLENYFIFLGVYSNPYTFLSQCDIYVQPSRFEGFGLAIAEARILGKPIVATNFSVIHNQLTNEKNGIIVNMDAESIYGGINKLVNNSRLVANLRTNLLNDKVGTEKELKKVYSLLEN